jgi:hypothetical protein
MLSVTKLALYAECRYAECHGALRVEGLLRRLVVISGGTVVEHSPHHPKVEGSNPATVGGIWDLYYKINYARN